MYCHLTVLPALVFKNCNCYQKSYYSDIFTKFHRVFPLISLPKSFCFSKTDTFGTANHGSGEKRNIVLDLYIGKSANAANYTNFAIRSLAIFKEILKQESIELSYADGNGLVSL